MPWPDGTPKFELHCHFGGSLDHKVIHSILVEQGRQVTPEQVRRRMVCGPDDRSFHAFLRKFDILNEIVWDDRTLARTIDSVVKLQASQNVDYTELSFSIDKYVGAGSIHRWSRKDVVKFISQAFQDACEKFRTQVGLVLALKMESPRESQAENMRLLWDDAVGDCFVGLDIVGDEAKFDPRFYKGAFRNWKSAGKVVVAHVGEVGGPENVAAAVDVLGATRIRHGLSARAHRDIIMRAKDNNICFDVALHSNLMAGTVADMREHILKTLLETWCPVTLGADDPVVFDCTIDREYGYAEELGLLGDRPADVRTHTLFMRANAVRYAARSRHAERAWESVMAANRRRYSDRP